ncbi:MAG: transporter substrate-binding domain-containing protein [Proteobacteria bacterium]|nr:transporter substrate-binding domain-containing protein [Pseudomonadota bacterium]MBU1612058.1 transporter substrate-binding domain-containing protein [Pseudomonadota bacterium]
MAVAQPLRVATEGAYPPFNMIDANGELTGFDVDIAKALCAAMSRSCELQVVAWDTIIEGLEQGKYEVIVASMAKTPERDARMEYTDYYYRSATAFVGRAGTPFTLSREGLAGKTLSAQAGTVQADYLKEKYPDSTLVFPETMAMVNAGLVAGTTDLGLMDDFSALDFFNTPEGELFDFVGEPLTDAEPYGTAYIQVTKGNVQLKDAINEALRQIRLDGSYARINAKYFPFSIY